MNESHDYWASRISLTRDEAAQDPATNEDRTRVEIFEFMHLGAGINGYAAYWRETEAPGDAHVIVTWTGAILAVIVNVCAISQGRVRYEAIGIDGERYGGVYDRSEGDLVLLMPTRRASTLT